MIFNWREYNTLAKEITKIPTKTIDISIIDCEASWRCAIGRAYYSAFCEARKYLDEIEELTASIEEEKKGIHQWVINKFDNQPGIKKTIYDNLKYLREQRRTADYKEQYFGLNLQKTELCTKKAEFVLNDLHQLRLENDKRNYSL
jgi:uncharacterized protein (UPF0332 family)